MRKLEHKEQTKFFKLVRTLEEINEDVRFVFAVPNGGPRHPFVAKRLKEEGVKRGVPDIFVPIPKNGYHGLFIEMKVEKRKLSREQAIFKVFLEKKNYLYYVCYSAEEAFNLLKKYLNI
ncbi:MAG: VRR-NUC domain-containing protein [Candidatus Dojkabacteria bacterium]|nr:VRR-NUC domain-containing protein [Candidatus Dojkabacteria bacterium]